MATELGADDARVRSAPPPAWGKYDRDNRSFHRLEHHCADVAACFEALIADDVLASRFATAAGTGSRLGATTASRLAVVAFYHDFAKLNAGFQFKVRDRAELPPNPPPKMGHIPEAFYCVQRPDMCEALGLFDLYETWGEGVDDLLRGALTHHGRPPQARHSGEGPSSLWQLFDGYDPVAAATTYRDMAREWFPEAFANGPMLPDTPALAHLFAGTVALADQIGSDLRHFPFVSEPDLDYIHRARRQAQQALADRGLLRAKWRSRDAGKPSFSGMFGHKEPRPLQTAVETAPCAAPLLILESETGSGKTEAAALRFATLQREGLVDGLYFAVPTRAAAKQLHERVSRAMKVLLPGWGDHTVLAVPGYIVAGEAKGHHIGGFDVFWEDKPDEADRMARWSAESARHFLGSTAAVGTVDQALLAGLKVKWAHLRGASLARSLLVVDEVHASDAYMTRVLTTLLDGHLATGGHALLMSATLGASARDALTRMGRGEETDPSAAARVPYPSLTLAGDGTATTLPIDGTGTTKEVSMETQPWLADAVRIADRARHAAEGGAKVLVIRNTVTTAQAVFEALVGSSGARLSLAVNGVATLHHSRFAAEDRRRLDDAVEAALGKDRPPGGQVVIGTQTLEQSLDIDADLLITDICPVDVLLQRIGRLHRHARQRPADHAQPRCIVLVPAGGLDGGLDGGLMRHGLGVGARGGGIYRDLLGIEQTRRLAVERPTWRIPAMNRELVERATHPVALRQLAQDLGGAWEENEQRTFGIAAAEAQAANGHCLDRSSPFAEVKFSDLDEDVRTRLGEEGPRFELAKEAVGPFGEPVRTFNLPAHLFRGSDRMPTVEEIEEAHLEPGDEYATLHVGVRLFRYDYAGIRRIDTPQA